MKAFKRLENYSSNRHTSNRQGMWWEKSSVVKHNILIIDKRIYSKDIF